MAANEQKRQRLQASVSEHSQRLQEQREKKQQLTAQLELQRTELLTLKSEFVQLYYMFILTIMTKCQNGQIHSLFWLIRNHSVIFINY